MKRLGLIARGDLTGLSVQTQAFWRHLQPEQTLVVDLSRHSRQKPDNRMMPNSSIWNDNIYPSTEIVKDSKLERFLRSVDVVFTCETPYNYWLFKRARELGVKTFLQFNYEFLDYNKSNIGTLPEPDVFLAPSMWHLDDVKKLLPGRDIRFLPVPVDRKAFPFKHRDHLDTLLHTAGTGAMEDRNGSVLSAEAMSYVSSSVKLHLRSQSRIKEISSRPNIVLTNSKVKFPHELYGDEQVFLMPRKFGGLCLPMNEAVSCGMPIISTDCSPQSTWLPEALLVPSKRVKTIETRHPIGLYESDPKDIARVIDWLADNPKEVSHYSDWADHYAESISWTKMKSVYLENLELN